MRRTRLEPNWVAAVFQNAAISIEIAGQTTFAQLAEQLNALAHIHGNLMLPVHVRLTAASSRSPSNRPWRHAG